MKTIPVSRYHPLLVTLHWVLAVLIVAMLCVGFLLLAPMLNSDPQKIGILLIHMSVGMVILALMAVRLIMRMWTTRPAAAATGARSAGPDRAGHPLRLLSSGLRDGRDRLCDGDFG